MVKRDSGAKRTDTGAAATASGSMADTVEQRVVAFAEQLGRMVGTVQAKAEGWMDRDALNEQIASVRDGAADLLKHLAGDETAASAKPRKSAPPKKPASRAGNDGVSGGRSGGVVDAPGKRHRKPIPNPTAAMASNARTANTMASKSRIAKMKLANQTRGRGRG